MSKSSAAPIRATDILGVHISAVNPALAVEAIAQAIITGAGGYVTVTGVHGVMESQHDAKLLAIHNGSLLSVPDGMPMVWLSRRVGAVWVSRVYGPDLMLAVLAVAEQRGWGSYLYGGGDGVAAQLGSSLLERFPRLIISGLHSPPFRPPTDAENAAVVAEIISSGARLVWVGLSTPKQERWMAKVTSSLPGVVLLGVGAAFDFHTGHVRQAPAWMQKRGLEWFFRLLVEPRRLWRRYLRNNPAFVAAIVRRRPTPIG